MNKEQFWKIRSANYDKLFWTKDFSYLDSIIKISQFDKSDIVLDVGTGTGTVAKAIKPLVKHVVAVDISDAMLEKGKWEGMSIVKWDISDHLFVNDLFDKVTARMVFHHIMNNLDRVMLRCYDLLKQGGKLIVAEGVPPTDEDEVVQWYTKMFRLKEERRTFKSWEMAHYLEKNGFVNLSQRVHIMEDFSVRNWVENSGLDLGNQNKIIDMHLYASKKIKDVYDMKIIDGDCFIKTKNVITVGEKRNHSTSANTI